MSSDVDSAIDLIGYPQTDLGNAERLIASHGSELRYCAAEKRWYHWTGKVWLADGDDQVVRLFGATTRQTQRQAIELSEGPERTTLVKWALTSESVSRIEAAVKLARSQHGVSVAPDAFDPDPLILNCANCIVDLKTGACEPHRSDRMCSRISPVEHDVGAVAPRFDRFLLEVFEGDLDLIRFLQRAAGYSLTGDTSHHALMLLHGDGRNGKSTLVELLRHVMGSYARSVQFDCLLEGPDSAGKQEQIARLRGARFVTASESTRGRTLDAARVKQLTGGDALVARFLYGHVFEFHPQFKLWLTTNHKPRIDDNSEGAWSRMRVVPFRRRFDAHERDAMLLSEMKAEAAGVLNWMLAGCRSVLSEGCLGSASAMARATQSYRAEEGGAVAFVTECVSRRAGAATPLSDMGRACETWCRARGHRSVGGSELRRALTAAGFKQGRSSAQRFWMDAALHRVSDEVGP